MGRDTSARHHRAFHCAVDNAISRQFHGPSSISILALAECP